MPGSAIGETIDIGRLICPLRYDILVRIEFIRLMRDEWSLFTGDFAAFRKRPAAGAYHRWFTEVCCPRYEPRLLNDPEALEAAFLQRVRRTAGLWQSFDRNGFDDTRPIRLLSGRSIRKVNGKAVRGRYFAGDGCHRIACLQLIGRTSLSPLHYEVVVRRTLEPLDNTAVLIQALPLEQPTYLAYLSRLYGGGTAPDSAEALLRHAASHKPELLPELKSVLAFDLPRLPQHG